MGATLLALVIALGGVLAGAPVASASGPGHKAVDFALTQVGDPYRYGGTGPNRWDCSGLAQASWRAAGIKIPRVSRRQHAALPAVPLDALQPGDLIFSYRPVSHVGLYVGEGQMVHAPSSGGVVEVKPVPWDVVVGAARPV